MVRCLFVGDGRRFAAIADAQANLRARTPPAKPVGS